MHNIRLFLVRHATSAANLDKTVNASLPDSRVPLAPYGHAQAVEAGRCIRPMLGNERVRMLVSPYLRTRQTADGLMEGLGSFTAGKFDRREELALREISFGLFDGIPDDELSEHFPTEHAHYQKYVEFEDEFYAPMPMGESRAEVADRVKSVFGTILRDAEPSRSDPIHNFIIVSHGVTIRAFIMQWLHYSPEWYNAEANPKNCSVTVIESDGVRPYELSRPFVGFERHEKSAQDRREENGISA